MNFKHRHFLILNYHKRIQRLWQFFFTGWGLILIAALAATPVLMKNLIWTPISAINMKEIVSNQFKMTDAKFFGQDKNDNPFRIFAKSARQEYDDADKLFLTTISAKTVRIVDGAKITDNINADSGIFYKNKNYILLKNNVRIDSSNGDRLRTDEMGIQL